MRSTRIAKSPSATTTVPCPIRYVLGVTEHGINVVDTQEAPPLAEDVLAEDERPAVSEMPDDIVDRALRSVA